MDAEQTLAEIERLERIFAVPDTRPPRPSDLAAANQRHDEISPIALGFGFGSGMAFVTEAKPNAAFDLKVYHRLSLLEISR